MNVPDESVKMINFITPHSSVYLFSVLYDKMESLHSAFFCILKYHGFLRKCTCFEVSWLSHFLKSETSFSFEIKADYGHSEEILGKYVLRNKMDD